MDEPVGTPRALDVNFSREPLWAYGFTSVANAGDKAQPQALPTSKPRPGEDLAEQTRPRQAAGSAGSYSLVQIRDLHNVIDWFPSDHPAMTDLILHGPAAMGEAGRGCGSCHLPNGRGRPEHAPVAGLPSAYFVRQIQDFRDGLRRSADPRKPNVNTMIELAMALSDAEVREGARYFGSISPYVPPGSLRRGKELVATGGMKIVGGRIVQGRTTACGTCHGLNLTGVVDADVPPIAGRSPSYLVLQMWDIQQGTRNGAQVQLMKLVLANLTTDDLTAIASYVATMPASAPPTAAPQATN